MSKAANPSEALGIVLDEDEVLYEGFEEELGAQGAGEGEEKDGGDSE